MAHVRRQQEDVAFLQVHAFGLAVDPQRQPGIAAHLVEELLQRIVVVVGAQVGAADHRDDEIGVLPDLLVADGRLQQMRVILIQRWKFKGGP